MFNIKPFQPNDLTGIRHLILPIQQQEFGLPVTWEDQTDLHNIPAFYWRGAGEFWVASADGIVIGTIALIDIGNSIGVIRKMFVAADWRGRGHGVAARLLDVLVDHSKTNGIKQLLLGTTDKFLAAHRFYERNGFSMIDSAYLPHAFPRMAVDTRFYQRTL